MRVVVIGATGNVGTATVQALAADPRISSILALSRRRPGETFDKTEWARADITTTDLAPLMNGADAVVHLAWMFQPSHAPLMTWNTNVLGTERVLRAVVDAGVPALVYASSVGAYSPRAKDRPVDESWPTHGRPTAAYSREKSYVERMLDTFEAENPGCRTVRMRPGFILKRESAASQRRIFAGPFLPTALVRPGAIPVVPDMPGLACQFLHGQDAGDAYRRAVTEDVRGAFNLAADPVMGPAELAEVLGARTVRVPPRLARAALASAWTVGLVPAAPQLMDMALTMPLMDITRARTELGWAPTRSAPDVLREFLDGLRTGSDMDTPPLAARTSGPMRIREVLTGVGRRPLD